VARGEDTANHPRRKVGREEMGTYNQELASWRAADATEQTAKSSPGDYAAYMRSIGMGHKVPKEK
jgi:hypothetical protein